VRAGMRWHNHTVHSGGVRLAVRDSGGDGTTAVLLHGLGAPQRSWDRVAPLLALHFRVVTYDQRGHGASAAASDYSLDAFLADLQAVLDTLAVEHPLLVGHSLGGLRAVEHAAARPGCAGVVGVDGGLKIERPPVGWAEAQAQLDRPVTRLLSRVVTALGMGVRLSFAELRRVADEAAEREDRLEEAYARLTCPLLVVLAANADPGPQGRGAAGRGGRRRHPPPAAPSAGQAGTAGVRSQHPTGAAQGAGRSRQPLCRILGSSAVSYPRPPRARPGCAELTRPPVIRGFALCLPRGVRTVSRVGGRPGRDRLAAAAGRPRPHRWRPRASPPPSPWSG
jgi:pimeloyl-ACP methyl ester carboxylesterase